MSILRILMATALIFAPSAAFADAFTVFQVQGTFMNGRSLSGTLTLDTTTGKFTSDSFQSPDSYAPPLPSLQGFNADGYYVTLMVSNDTVPYGSTFLYLTLPTLPSAGQTLSINAPDSNYEDVSGLYGQYRTIYYLTTGEISPLAVSTITPEPSSFMFLSTGLIAVGAAFRRRLCC